jgi:hypothetical protein
VRNPNNGFCEEAHKENLYRNLQPPETNVFGPDASGGLKDNMLFLLNFLQIQQAHDEGIECLSKELAPATSEETPLILFAKTIWTLPPPAREAQYMFTNVPCILHLLPPSATEPNQSRKPKSRT